MGNLFKDAPLVEALCDFRFATLTGEWDLALPGRLYERLRDEFPTYSQISEIGVELQISGVELPPTAQVLRGASRLRLARQDNSAFVQVGSNLLTINVTKPYQGWPAFRKLIVSVLSEYVKLLQEQPVEQLCLDQVGLRYINHLSPLERSFEIGNFITVVPDFLGPLDLPLSGFYQRYNIAHEERGSTLIHQTAVIEKDDEVALVLDLEFNSQKVGSFTEIEQIELWLDQAHEQVSLAFKASLTSAYYDSLTK
jgi:uncharacterized protein (TIGR04255 family)